jgi:nucleotide-binding universal stress UspA family protein
LAIRGENADPISYQDALRQRADHALTEFENIARQIGVSQLEKRRDDNDAMGSFSVQVRYCDLVVMGQRERDNPLVAITSDLPEHVAMNGGSPVLVIPYAGDFQTIGERVLIAWNGSLEATRAVHQAIPLLKQARKVEVALFQPVSQPDQVAIQMGTDITAYLAGHEIKAAVIRKSCDQTTEGRMGTLLLSLAADLGSDLLVMGCYGQPRFREILLGGASRTVLESMTIPVLMAH